jgi:hypothetical protein
VERFAEYDARFNRMEEKMEVLERDNAVLREALETHRLVMREIEDQVTCSGLSSLFA